MPWPALSMFAESCITSVSISGSCIPSVVTNSQHNSPNLRPSCRSTRTSIPKSCNTSWVEWTRHSRISCARVSGSHDSKERTGSIPSPIPRRDSVWAVVKTCTMKRSAHGWFATLVFEHQPVPLPANDLAVGIDVGVTSFAKFSDGTKIQNPRIYQNTQAELRRAQRRVARRKKGSHRRGRAVLLLQKVHQGISNRRSDFLHKHSTEVIRKYGTVKVEGLNVSGMS